MSSIARRIVTAFADRVPVLPWPAAPAWEAQQRREEVRAQPLQELKQQDAQLAPAAACSLLPGVAPNLEVQRPREEVCAQRLQEAEH
jgi:hypothetical protein